MSIECRQVDGPAFAAQASELLTAAWPPPAIRYSPEYMEWQLSFPAPWKTPAVAAFDGATPIGFAGATPRRVRYLSNFVDLVVVSFVAVAPQSRNLGVAGMLYHRLLSAIREIGAPVMTFAVPGSDGKRAIERAYPAGGFSLRHIGTFPLYGFIGRNARPASGWGAVSAAPETIAHILQSCDFSERIWSAPSASQIEHYRRDPRRRILFCHEHSGSPGGAWAVRTEFTTMHGFGSVTTIESVWLNGCECADLQSLCAVVATAFESGPDPSQQVIHMPNLQAFKSEDLRASGIRRLSSGFEGFIAEPDRGGQFENAVGTNIEVV